MISAAGRWLPIVLAFGMVGGAAEAQVAPRPRPSAGAVIARDTLPARRDSLRVRPDTLTRRDTTLRADTSLTANFAAPDSVMQRLLALPGYTATRYQSETISFDAVTQAIRLTNQAILQRGDSQVVKSDRIIYGGTGSTVQVQADPNGRNVFVVPGQAPIISRGSGTYDIASRSATVRGVRTSIPQSGETLYITGEEVKAVLPANAGVGDSTNAVSANSAVYYVKDGAVTSCDDSIPDYYFKANEIKRTGSFVVARPAVLYIGDVPVLWLPFLFQDVRSGRHSGLLAPNVGVSDIVRNSPSYRRSVEGLGYYFALSNYLDSQVSLDWRSGAGEAISGDAGFMRYTGEVNYKWLERFTTGTLALSQTRQATSRNTAVTWRHQENFTRNSSLTTNINYATNTQLQRLTTVNPYAAIATISSQANYQQKLGPAQLSLGGSQKQYPGRTLLDRSFPTVNFTTSPLSLGTALSWTPSLSYSSTQSLGIDQPTSLGLLQTAVKTAAGLDSTRGDTLRRSAYTSSLSVNTPLTIFGYNIGNSFSLNSARNDFPEREIVTDVLTAQESERIYSTTYRTEFNWVPSFTLPPLGSNRFNLAPSLSFENVDGSAFAVRNERTGGQWVSQSKRPTFSLSASPTVYGLFNGFGPFSRFRHAISPSVSYSYAPAHDVSNDFLTALGRTRFNRNGGLAYFGGLRQNAISFGLNTNIEAKTKSPNDSNPELGDKLKILSLNFTSLSYDFERAHAAGSAIRGLTTSSFGYTAKSDLLPGFDVGVDYSLFEGSTLSDSARFAPFRERITASFSFSRTANPFAVFSRLFGKAVPLSIPNAGRNDPLPDERYARQVASQPVAGRGAHSAAFLPTNTKGWEASLNFSSSRQRPLAGNASNVIAFDPTVRCQQFNTPVLRAAYEQCVRREQLNPAPDRPITSGTVGSPIFLTPPVTSLSSNLSLDLTEHWAATWQSQFDFVTHDFASQIVSLQRDLHDWRAIFGFTQSANGSFAFSFLVSLKAEPELKFDYRKSTYRNEGLR